MQCIKNKIFKLFIALCVILPLHGMFTSNTFKRIQKIQGKVVRGKRRSLSYNQEPYEKILTVEGQTQIIHYKTCYFHSSVGVIKQSRLGLSNKCPECMNENLEYYSVSTSRLFEYILNNIN